MVFCGPVFDNGNQTEVGKGQIHLDIHVNLLVAQLGEAIDVLEGFINEMEDLTSIALLENLVASKNADVEIEAFLHQSSYLGVFLGYGIGHDELKLHVVVVLLPTSKLFHELGIVGIVIDGGHRSELIKAIGKHTLGVEVCEAEGTDNLRHASLTTKLSDRIKQCTRHINIVHHVYPPETHAFALPAGVSTAVNDRCHTAHNTPLAIGKEIIGLAKVKSGILILRQRVHIVAEKRGHIVGIALVQIVMEVYKMAQIAAGSHFLDGNS